MKIPGSEFSSVNWMLRSNRAFVAQRPRGLRQSRFHTGFFGGGGEVCGHARTHNTYVLACMQARVFFRSSQIASHAI